MSDENVTATPETSAAALIEQVWGTESGPAVATEPVEPAVEAEGTEPAAAVEEPAKEPAKDPVAEKVASRILAAKRAEMRAAEQRRELASAKAEIDAQRASVAEQLKAVEDLKAAKLSPSKALELLGMTPKQFLESLATEHEPAAVAARASAGAMSEVEKLRSELQAMRDAQAERERAVRVQQIDAAYNERTEAFVAHVDGEPEKYPHLIAEYTPTELAQAARAAADQHAVPYFNQFGKYPDDDVIAEYLEEQAKARAEALAERRARIGRPASPPSQGNPIGQTAVVTPTDPGPGPRTLTSRDASIKASAPKPWSQDAADEESLRILQAAMRSG